LVVSGMPSESRTLAGQLSHIPLDDGEKIA